MRELIGENLFYIPGRRKGHYPHCNSILLAGEESVLIDPASDKKEMTRIFEEGLDAVLLSHYHTDHMRYLKLFPDSRIHIHEIEAPALEDFDVVLDYVFFPEEGGREKWKKRKIREVGGWGFKAARTFKDDDSFRFGDTEIKVIHTPGHTPGHSCFWFPGQEVLYSGDIDFSGFGPWYGNGTSSVDEFLSSIEKLKSVSPKVTVTAHEMGMIEGDITDRLEKFERVIRDRESKLLDHLKEPLTLQELTDKAVIYGKYYSPTNFTAKNERRMVRHHLESVIKRGLVKQEGDRFLLS